MQIVLADSEKDLSLDIIAPIAPGLVNEIKIKEFSLLNDCDTVTVDHIPSVLSLDGEREVEVKVDKNTSIRFSRKGPYVLELDQVFKAATKVNFFATNRASSHSARCLLHELGLCSTPCED